MSPCEALAYGLGAASALAGASALAYQLGRRAERRAGRRFDPDAPTDPEPRRFGAAAETMAESRRSLASRIEAERKTIAAERGGPKKGRPP